MLEKERESGKISSYSHESTAENWEIRKPTSCCDRTVFVVDLELDLVSMNWLSEGVQNCGLPHGHKEVRVGMSIS